MEPITSYAIAAVVGYLLGSIPVALLVGRAHGVDLRTLGDRNPGAWNALEQLGPRAAAPVFAGDGAKGLLAGIAGLLLGGIWGAYAGIAGAMIGHALPVFASFRGGKAVMTFVGGACVLSPPAAGIALLLCIAVSLAASSFAIGARVGVFAFPVLQLVFAPVSHVIATGGLMCIVGLLFGIARLRTGHSRQRSAH